MKMTLEASAAKFVVAVIRELKKMMMSSSTSYTVLKKKTEYKS